MASSKGYFTLAAAGIETGNKLFSAMLVFWNKAALSSVRYLSVNPATDPDTAEAWALVTTGGVWNAAATVAASLVVLFFVLGWLKDSIDIHVRFTLDSMFRILIRVALTVALINSSLALAESVLGVTTAFSAAVWEAGEAEVQADLQSDESADERFGYFSSVYEAIVKSYEDDADGIDRRLTAKSSDEDSSVGSEDLGLMDALAVGAICLIGGLIGGVTVMICGVELILTVCRRIFKLLVCIPLAPVAFSSFAGGSSFNRMGKTWIRSFVAFAMEAVVIALALRICTSLVGHLGFESWGEDLGITAQAIVIVAGQCLPMVIAVACTKGADRIVRRNFG